jgi:peptidyl-prolyl cis-trans isomerase SurA
MVSLSGNRLPFAAMALAAALWATPLANNVAAIAEPAQVLVTVNDKPITTYDVQQRIALWKLVGGGSRTKSKDVALNDLIDDIAEIEEARKLGLAASEAEVDQRMESIAKSLKTDSAGLKGKLKAQGISLSAMRQYIAAQFAFHRLIRAKDKVDTSVSDAEVKKRVAAYRAEIDGKINSQIAKLEADPRRKPITVYQLLEVNFPIDGELTQQLLQSRAVEVAQFLSRYKGCKSARAAASGIFNVRVGRQIEADATKIPKQLKQALDSVKPGNALGPVRSPNGLQALGFCGVRKIVPPKIKRPTDVQYPTADQVRNQLEQEKMAKIMEQYRGKWRQGLLIEYRDPSLVQ